MLPCFPTRGRPVRRKGIVLGAGRKRSGGEGLCRRSRANQGSSVHHSEDLGFSVKCTTRRTASRRVVCSDVLF